MADEDVKISIKSTSDNSGIEKTEKAIDRVGKAAKAAADKSTKAAADVNSGFGGVGRSIEKVTSTIGKLNAALTGFGVAGVFMGLVSSISNIVESFKTAKREAENFRKEAESAARKEAVDELAKSYERLTAAMAESAKQSAHENEILNMRVKNARALEDAESSLAEQKELAAVDASDPLANEKRNEIRARYQASRTNTQAARAREDIVYARQVEQGNADRLNREADQIEGTIEDDREMIDRLKHELQKAFVESVSDNEEDNTGFWGAWGSGMKKIVTGNWGALGDTHSAAGDEIRKSAAARVKELDSQIKALEGGIEAKQAQASGKRSEARNALEKRDAYDVSAAEVNREATDIAGRTAVAAARKTTAVKAASIARDEETMSSGATTIAGIKGQIAANELAQQSAQDAHDRERMDVFRAQNALDTFNAENAGRGGASVRRRRAALVADLARETEEVQASEVELKKTMNALTSSLQSLKKQLAEVTSKVNQAQSRQNAAADAAPAGE